MVSIRACFILYTDSKVSTPAESPELALPSLTFRDYSNTYTVSSVQNKPVRFAYHPFSSSVACGAPKPRPEMCVLSLELRTVRVVWGLLIRLWGSHDEREGSCCCGLMCERLILLLIVSSTEISAVSASTSCYPDFQLFRLIMLKNRVSSTSSIWRTRPFSAGMRDSPNLGLDYHPFSACPSSHVGQRSHRS
jgi:hypothetical protein